MTKKRSGSYIKHVGDVTHFLNRVSRNSWELTTMRQVGIDSSYDDVYEESSFFKRKRDAVEFLKNN